MGRKLRSVNTKFWDDSFIGEMEPSYKLLFLYLITNPLTSLVGIYEISARRMSFDTNLDEKEIQRGLDKFSAEGKVIYDNNYILLPNWLKNQNLNANMKKAVVKEFTALPTWLINKILGNNLKSLPNDYETIRKGLETIWEVKQEVKLKTEDEFISKYVEPEEREKINFSDLENMQWFESILRYVKLKISMEELNEYWCQFQEGMIADDDLYRGKEDYRSHFRNWVKIQIEKNEKNSTNNGRKGFASDTTQRGLKNLAARIEQKGQELSETI